MESEALVCIVTVYCFTAHLFKMHSLDFLASALYWKIRVICLLITKNEVEFILCEEKMVDEGSTHNVIANYNKLQEF